LNNNNKTYIKTRKEARKEGRTLYLQSFLENLELITEDNVPFQFTTVYVQRSLLFLLKRYYNQKKSIKKMNNKISNNNIVF